MTNLDDLMNKANDLFGDAADSGNTPQQNFGGFDMQGYLNRYGISFKEKQNGTKTLYILDHCVFDLSHTHKDAAVIVHGGGTLGYNCFHDSCQGKSWKDARSTISGTDSLAPFMPGSQSKGQRVGSKEPNLEDVMVIPLQDHPVPAFDVRLPEILGEMCYATAAATETPPELGAAMALGTVATAIHGKFIVSVKPGYIEPTNLFLVAALDPSHRKSAVNSIMTAPLTKWEAGQRDLLSESIRQVESENKSKEARIKALRGRYGKAKSAEDADKIQADIFDLEMSIEEVPRVDRLWCQDITPERLGVMLAMNSGRMAIISAEGGIFEIAGGRYSNGIPNLDTFLMGYSGDSLRVDRQGREPLFVEKPALSMVLSPQPEVLRSIGEKKSFRGRGLLARFWYFVPTSNLGFRTFRTRPIPEPVETAWHNLIFDLLSIKPQADDGGQVEPYVICISEDAYEVWLEFAKVVEADMREGRRFEYLSDWAGKLPGTAARVAGNLHCVKHSQQPWATEISIETMETALDLAAIASSHAEIAFGLMGADSDIEGAKKVWKWIESQHRAEFTRSDCFQALRSTFSRVKHIEGPLSVLEERNYVSSEITQPGPQGGRPSIIYTVNPVIEKRWS